MREVRKEALDRAWMLILNIAAFSRYSVDSTDDQLEDAIATLNRLRAEAQSIRNAW
jgi:hypothetical protein